MRRGLLAVVVAMLMLVPVSATYALDEEHWRKADTAIQRGIEYLRTTQNPDGSWSPDAGPAITAMAMQVMLQQRNIGPDDPHVARALDFILSQQKPDGGIYTSILQNYNTAIALSALSRVSTRPDVAEAIRRAQDYLRNLQWHNQPGPDGQPIDENHPYYGGAGYGRHGRPDLSNTQIMLQGLHDSGLDCEDPAFQRAIVFISRLQGVPENDMFGPDVIVQDGGFIYATSINQDLVGVPQSMASPEMIDEAKAGRPVSGLRTYGSMTYAGFKSYVYAELDREDPRVLQALDWIQRNYTLDQNPGMPERIREHGLYYYYLTFARALRAWGTTTVDTTEGPRDWANDVIAAVVARQAEDGSWANDADRWMEGDRNLVTAYSLLVLQEAMR
jgi:squalene-hopene/tetraprenyl-beta-curcumene cyclase